MNTYNFYYAILVSYIYLNRNGSGNYLNSSLEVFSPAMQSFQKIIEETVLTTVPLPVTQHLKKSEAGGSSVSGHPKLYRVKG